MKKLAFALALAVATLAFAATPRDARAEYGTADQVPAATLLLPYFEVKLDDPTGVTTSFSINNATATAVLAHVTLWTDEGVPTFNFDVYLTGYDAQNINLRSIFDGGMLPITADAATDPTDTISPKGPLSQDINFPPSSMTPTVGTCEVPYASPELTSAERRHLRTAHTGRRSDVLNGCAGANYGDLVARGYVTVDVINTCTSLNPTDPSYFTSFTTVQNVLWGDYTISSEAQNSEIASSLVHIEACGGLQYVGNNQGGICSIASGDYSFYGRLNGFTATDQREPLATTFATRFVNGGTFNGGTDLLVWRDNKKAPTGANGKHNCNKKPAWFPLSQSDVVSFDETENPADLCFLPDNVSPPIGGVQSCFPLVTQRVSTATGNPIGKPMNTPQSFGWVYLNLNHTVAGDLQPGVAQAWVESVQSASGRFAVGFQAIPFDNASRTNPGGTILIP
ncbi:hypothetical protein K2Z84_26765 [Candidatus Binatia bacterium]|nr:hypothetical protein [Candidatus Binatia bacterium]